MDFLNGLNPQQKKAVTTTEGPLLILAGAGSGKTRVLTHRIAYLIQEKGIHSGSILAITFTNKAAGEMKERVFGLLGEQNHPVWVSTFHSACVRFLRHDIEKIGYNKNFVIYDSADQLVVVKDCLKELNINEKNFSPKKVLGMIGRAKDNLQSPEEFIASAEDSFYAEQIGRVYRLYRKKLKSNNALDFDDLILKALDLFNGYPEVLSFYQNKFRYILVDEYQDTNTPQYRLVHLLSQSHRNLCVVGDDDQSIYKFRGANIANILDFEVDYPEATVIKLEQNYRSTKNILDAANCVIANNSRRKAKKLWTKEMEGYRIRCRQAATERQEAEFVVCEAMRLCADEGRKLSDVAVLYRTNAQSRVLEEAFITRAVPYKVVGSLGFYQRKEIKDVLAYLRVILNPADDISLKRIINQPRRGIGDKTIEILEQYASRLEISLFEALTGAVEQGYIATGPARRVKEFSDMMKDLIGIRDKHSVVAFISEVLDKTGYVKALEQEDTIESRGRIENIKELVSAAVGFEESHEGESTLLEFLERVALVSETDNLDEGEGVTLMTLHSAKGLEFPVVFVTGMEDGVFPLSRAIDEPEELEEERRLCYVGMTRAKEVLYLTRAELRTLYGQTHENPPSKFLREVPEYLMEVIGSVPDNRKRARARKPGGDSAGGYRPGSRIQHRIWGMGTVIKAEDKGDDTEITIAFPGRGVKKMPASEASLKALR
ncbi:MAG: DNA helicase PcrA [Bacillota bacterium]|nr:DNA helicase PcrA [Bacillota bacterium]MDD3297388.1 DNA helicase PcrA [Bacillota bacterium]MDD3850646.1 DNA helicase PcrA [Bacillota bacterium]MDD4707107.1 DNA helicase PcrA [Bacillota bacterium]